MRSIRCVTAIVAGRRNQEWIAVINPIKCVQISTFIRSGSRLTSDASITIRSFSLPTEGQLLRHSIGQVQRDIDRAHVSPTRLFRRRNKFLALNTGCYLERRLRAVTPHGCDMWGPSSSTCANSHGILVDIGDWKWHCDANCSETITFVYPRLCCFRGETYTYLYFYLETHVYVCKIKLGFRNVRIYVDL